MRQSAALRELLALPTTEAARALLGWRIESVDPGGGALAARRVAGRIVETEAYLGSDDAASHSARGRTARNASMFTRAGRAYVYLIYGMHHCLNVVTGPEGTGEAVLIRALEPLEGLDVMRERRGARVRTRDLCRGPGRVCQALGLTRSHDGHDLGSAPLRLLPPSSAEPRVEVIVGPRVGITKSRDLPLRFRIADSEWTT